MLLQCASEALLELGDNPKWLGARLGVTALLHTWTREMLHHPHVHCVVTGGGLRPDYGAFVHARKDFLFPVRVLGELFRGKFMARLVRANEQGRLHFAGACAALADPECFKRLSKKLYQLRWVVYCKRPFGGPRQVYEYLGRYTHRVGISNQRLVSVGEDTVTFRTHGDTTITLPAQQFLTRFLTHVLPPHFVKIRHTGLLAPQNVATQLAAAAILLPLRQDEPVFPQPPSTDYRDILQRRTGVDLARCPQCGGPLKRTVLERAPGRRKTDTPPSPVPPDTS
jgi:hypothetical protein